MRPLSNIRKWRWRVEKKCAKVILYSKKGGRESSVPESCRTLSRSPGLRRGGDAVLRRPAAPAGSRRALCCCCLRAPVLRCGIPGQRARGFKGTVSRDFLLQVFFMNHESSSPKPPKITLGSFRIFSNSRRYSQVKVHHWYRWHRRQILPPVLMVLLIPAANLPPVSMTPVALSL